MTQNERYNTIAKACYNEQTIEEACNGDDKKNHFREELTVEKCEEAYAKANEMRQAAFVPNQYNIE